MSAKLRRAGCNGPSLAPGSPALVQLHGTHKGQLDYVQPNISVADGCYLEWSRWAADVNMGLLHQMGSLGCAIADASAVNRTLLLPTHICGYKHNHRLKGQSMCVGLDDLLDLALLSRLVDVRLGSSEIRDRTRAINFYCPSADVRTRFPCGTGGDGSERLIMRALNDMQFWYEPCTMGTIDTTTIQVRLLESLGNVVEDVEHSAGTRSNPSFAPRGVAFTLLRSGLFFAPAIKAAAAAIRSRLGPYVHVHVRRGDRISHFGSAPGVDVELRENLTRAESISNALQLWFPQSTTIYVAASDDRPRTFAPLERHFPRLFFAENFTAELAGTRTSTYQLFAVELLLALGAEAYVETFATQMPLFRESCFPATALAASGARLPEDVRGGHGIRVTRVEQAPPRFEVNGVTYGRACLRNTPCADATHELYLVGRDPKQPWPRGCGDGGSSARFVGSDVEV